MSSHIVSNSNLKPDIISFGNPCIEYKKITDDYGTKVIPDQTVRKNTSKDELVSHSR